MATTTATLKRRDLLEACKLANITLDKLEASSIGQMALAYLAEHRAGRTELTFEGWLDEDLEIEVDDGDEDEAPAPS